MPYDPKKHGADCANCPRKKQTPVPPEGKPDSIWVWIGQDPHQQDVRQLRPFVGPAGSRLERIWQQAGLAAGRPVPRSEVWITNAALCPPVTEREKEAADAVRACRPRLLKELKQAHPDAAVLLMGKLALLAVTGQAKGMGGLSGFSIPLDLKEMKQLIEEKKKGGK